MTDDSDFRDDHDSPWKEALEHYFPEFLSLLFPSIHGEIDWTRPFEFLDHELQQVVGDAELGRRYADKLVKVFTQNWVLRLPPALEQEFLKEIYAYEKARQMPYITSVERIGIQKGIQRGEATLLLRLLELRFGAADRDVIQRIHEADSETLLRWSDRILTAQSLAELLE